MTDEAAPALALVDDNGSTVGKFSMGDRIMAGDPLFGVHGAALALRAQRLSMLASNIANAATPNYKARDIDFDAALKDATDGAAGPASIDRAAQDALRYRVPIQPAMDGNTVELSTEQTAFAENAVQYKTTLSFLEGRIATVMTALRGE